VLVLFCCVNVAGFGGLLVGASPSSSLSPHPLSVRGTESWRGKWEEGVRETTNKGQQMRNQKKMRGKEKQKREMNWDDLVESWLFGRLERRTQLRSLDGQPRVNLNPTLCQLIPIIDSLFALISSRFCDIYRREDPNFLIWLCERVIKKAGANCECHPSINIRG
jgi:hypothetical protein